MIPPPASSLRPPSRTSSSTVTPPPSHPHPRNHLPIHHTTGIRNIHYIRLQPASSKKIKSQPSCECTAPLKIRHVVLYHHGHHGRNRTGTTPYSTVHRASYDNSTDGNVKNKIKKNNKSPQDPRVSCSLPLPVRLGGFVRSFVRSFVRVDATAATTIFTLLSRDKPITKATAAQADRRQNIRNNSYLHPQLTRRIIIYTVMTCRLMLQRVKPLKKGRGKKKKKT